MMLCHCTFRSLQLESSFDGPQENEGIANGDWIYANRTEQGSVLEHHLRPCTRSPTCCCSWPYGHWWRGRYIQHCLCGWGSISTTELPGLVRNTTLLMPAVLFQPDSAYCNFCGHGTLTLLRCSICRAGICKQPVKDALECIHFASGAILGFICLNCTRMGMWKKVPSFSFSFFSIHTQFHLYGIVCILGLWQLQVL